MNLFTHISSGRGIVMSIFLILVSIASYAQQADSTRNTGWAIKTNALEWLLTIPNLNFEVDLSKSPYNKMTLGLTAKYNWQTYHKYTPYCVFNLMDIRPELRYYFRTHAKERERDGKFWDAEDWFDYKFAVRKEPKGWRTYYVGAYMDYATYAFKFAPEGIQGFAYGLGLSYGYGIPLYQYKKFAIDLELGASVGLLLTKYDKFAHNPEGYYYYPTEQKKLHPVPFPVVSELRVAFAFRPVSIKDKYKGGNPEQAEYRRLMDNVSISLMSSRKNNFDSTLDSGKEKEYAANDSLYLADFTAYLDEAVEWAKNDVEKRGLSKKYNKKAMDGIAEFRKEILEEFNAELHPEEARGNKRSKPAKPRADKQKKNKKAPANEE